MSGGDTASCRQQVIHMSGDQAAVGDLIPLPVPKEVVGGSGSFRIMNIHIIIRGGYGVGKPGEGLQVRRSQRIFPVNFAAFTDADLDCGGKYPCPFKAFDIILEKTI